MTETAARRAVPHINHTPELEAAAIAVVNAKDWQGRMIVLCTNPLDVHAVRQSMGMFQRWSEDIGFYSDGEPEGFELGSVENLILLATLLREHLRAGNT